MPKWRSSKSAGGKGHRSSAQRWSYIRSKNRGSRGSSSGCPKPQPRHSTIHSSARLYYEAGRRPLQLGPGERVTAPCGVARFPYEAPAPPREWVERGYDVHRWTAMPRGGHFAAMEEPELLAEDIRAFFRPLR